MTKQTKEIKEITHDKVVLVTGGSTGLGLQLVQDYLELGYKVVSISRTKRNIEAAKRTLGKLEADFFIGDVSNSQSLDDLFAHIKGRYGHLDVLVNNAGIIRDGGIEHLADWKWDEMIDVNLTAVFKFTQKMVPLLKLGKNSNIVNISSISSSLPGSSIAYSATKAGVDMMSKSFAKELSSFGIRVNSVNPGLINTGFQIANQLVEREVFSKFLETAAKDYPLGIGTAKDVADLVTFVTSDKARWITGSTFVIDGGRTLN